MGFGESTGEEVGRRGAPASGFELDGLGEAVWVWVMVLVLGEGVEEGVMVMTTVMRIVEGVGRGMTEVEVVVRVVREGRGVEEGAGRTPKDIVVSQDIIGLSEEGLRKKGI